MTPAAALLLLGAAGGLVWWKRKVDRAWELTPGAPGPELDPNAGPGIPPDELVLLESTLDETPPIMLVGEQPASQWLLSLPRESIRRDDMIVERYRDLDFNYSDIQVQIPGHVLDYSVWSDATKIDGVRITVTARCAQMLADRLACVMTTPKMEDDIFGASAVALPVMTENINTMSSNRVMIDHSRKIDQVLLTSGIRPGTSSVLIGNVGKSWNLGNNLRYPKAMNYGFFSPRAPHASVTDRYRVIQQPGTWHDLHHYDYSQNCRLCHRLCILDGRQIDIHDVMRSPELAPLLSVEGPLTVLRQPGVPESAS